jgi:hypothetical protein
VFTRFRAVAVLLVAAVAATWLATTPAAAAGTRTIEHVAVERRRLDDAPRLRGRRHDRRRRRVDRRPRPRHRRVQSELCRQQYDSLVTRLRAAGWPEDGSNFARWQTDLASGCGGAGFGQAVFTRNPAGGARRTLLPEDNRAESHYLLCVPINGTNVVGCGTHITIDSTLDAAGVPANTDQLAAALATVDGYTAQGSTVTVGGDFNAQPQYGRIAAWHADWTELDDTDARCTGYGEWTATGTPAPHRPAPGAPPPAPPPSAPAAGRSTCSGSAPTASPAPTAGTPPGSAPPAPPSPRPPPTRRGPAQITASSSGPSPSRPDPAQEAKR